MSEPVLKGDVYGVNGIFARLEKLEMGSDEHFKILEERFREEEVRADHLRKLLIELCEGVFEVDGYDSCYASEELKAWWAAHKAQDQERRRQVSQAHSFRIKLLKEQAVSLDAQIKDLEDERDNLG